MKFFLLALTSFLLGVIISTVCNMLQINVNVSFILTVIFAVLLGWNWNEIYQRYFNQ